MAIFKTRKNKPLAILLPCSVRHPLIYKALANGLYFENGAKKTPIRNTPR